MVEEPHEPIPHPFDGKARPAGKAVAVEAGESIFLEKIEAAGLGVFKLGDERLPVVRQFYGLPYDPLDIFVPQVRSAYMNAVIPYAPKHGNQLSSPCESGRFPLVGRTRLLFAGA